MIGSRLRELRVGRGLSLRALAVAVNLSPTLLSQIERGQVEPSLKSLRSIAGYFGTAVSTLFDEPDGERVHVSRPGRRSRLSAPQGQIQYERITRGNGRLEVLRGLLQPGETSSDDLWGHDAIECAYVLVGTVRLQVGDGEHEVSAGEAITFDSNQPHRYLNTASDPVEFLLSVTPPTP